MSLTAKPKRYINSLAPIRICDLGGWTDTWFAGHGRVFNIAVAPQAQVQIEIQAEGQPGVWLNVEDYGERYRWQPEVRWGAHPLLEAALQALPPPADLAVEISVHCAAPAGASTGTSAAVAVALVGALARLGGADLTPGQAARVAHSLETEWLGQQSGIQDQLAAAYGGVNEIVMEAYPQAEVRAVELAPEIAWELEQRLALVYLGRSHQSSAVHKMVIAHLEEAGPQHPALERLRQLAAGAPQAVQAGAWAALGELMQKNTAAQADLHPGLVCAEAWQVIALARRYGAVGWKVNGAGGEGGSLTILGGVQAAERRRLLAAIRAANPAFRVIPLGLSERGLRVWEDDGREDNRDWGAVGE